MPGANSESSSTLNQYATRGLYPDRGYFAEMRAGNPAIDSAMTASYYRRHAKPFRLLDREGLDGLPLPQIAVDRAGRVREQVQNAYFGINGTAAEWGDRADQAGASMFEVVLEPDQHGEFGLKDAVPVESWTWWSYLQDQAGFPTHIKLRGASGLTDWLDMRCFALYANRGNQRTPEGHSKLRPAWWRHEDVRKMLVKAAKARDRAGLPKRRYRIPQALLDNVIIRAAIVENERRLSREEETYSVEPAEIEVKEEQGPTTMPGYREAIRDHEHSFARLLGDTLNEEGVAVAGARAAVVEQRKSAELSDLGQDLAIARAMTRELIYRIYDANGWPRSEAPYVWVTGWPDTDAWRALVEIMRLDQEIAQRSETKQGFLTSADYAKIAQHARLSFGWGLDRV